MSEHITEIFVTGKKVGELKREIEIGTTQLDTMVCPDCLGKKTARSIFTENGWVRQSSKHKCSI